MVTFEDLKSGRVKPEFGNMEHIRAIKAHQAAQEEAAKEDCDCCDGAGEIECCECGQDRDCPECDGSGKKNG